MFHASSSVPAVALEPRVAAPRADAEAVRADRTRLALAMTLGGLRAWEWDLTVGEFTWSTGPDAVHPATGEDEAATIVAADLPGVRLAMAGALRDGRDFDHEFRVRTPVGVRWISARASADIDPAGRPVRMVGVAADVTDSHDIADELRRSQAFLGAVVENVPTLVFVKDATDLHYVSVNRACEDVLGFTSDEIVGRDAFSLFPDQADLLTAQDRAVLDGGELVDFEAQPMIGPGGEERLLHTRMLPLSDESGLTRYLLGISDDVTEQQSVRRRLEEAHRDADRANEAKSLFLSRMSHELRTPLNAVLGFAYLLASQPLTDDQATWVAHIDGAGHHLLALIDDVLDIGKIESGNMTLTMEHVSVSAVAVESVDLVRPEADRRGVRVQFAADWSDVYALADRQRLLQVLLNLLSNALKYNRRGGFVELSCQRSGGTVSISVTDDGVGIAVADLARLFTPFERLGAELTGVEGTGVGLVLTRTLMQQMSGSLTVSSAVDRGSTFTVELPEGERVPQDRSAAAAVPDAAGSSDLDVVRVLCIDDDESTLHLLDHAFREVGGVDVVSATTGRVGLDLAFAHPPDVILLDLRLSDLTGEEVLASIEADRRTAAIPVVICSADASTTRIAALLDLGAASYLTKPIDPLRLGELVEQVRRGRGVHVSGRAGAAS